MYFWRAVKLSLNDYSYARPKIITLKDLASLPKLLGQDNSTENVVKMLCNSSE